jgi:hypothetical protein
MSLPHFPVIQGFRSSLSTTQAALERTQRIEVPLPFHQTARSGRSQPHHTTISRMWNLFPAIGKHIVYLIGVISAISGTSKDIDEH